MKRFEFVEGLNDSIESYYNGKYQAIVSRGVLDSLGREMIVLSIRREDRKPIMDWRDMQWIKNQLLGPEVEAVQLFPAESRLVDTSNQYYLSAYAEPGYRFPFGFITRGVTERISVRVPGGQSSQQRPFAKHVRPPDLEEQEKNVVNIINELNAKGVKRREGT